MENKEQHYALIKDSKVQNIIVADDSFIEIIKSEYDHIICADSLRKEGTFVALGWSYVDGKFVDQETEQSAE